MFKQIRRAITRFYHDNEGIIETIKIVIVAGAFLLVGAYVFSVIQTAIPTPSDANLSTAFTLVISNVAIALRLLAIGVLVVGATAILAYLDVFGK